MNYEKKRTLLKWILGIISVQLLFVTSGCFSTSQNSRDINKTNHLKPYRVLVLTGGHGFAEKPFYKIFAGFENTAIDHVGIKNECTYFDDISQWEYDVIVFYNFRNKLTRDGRKNLLKLCDKGIGMVVLHHAIAGFPGWEMWPKMVGAQYFLQDTVIGDKVWKRCRYMHGVAYHVAVEKSNAAVTAGLKDFEIVDETYKGYRLEPGNQIILTTDEPLSQKEIGWARIFQKSKICYIQPGHDKEAFENRNYQQLLKQSIDWVAKPVQ